MEAIVRAEVVPRLLLGDCASGEAVPAARSALVLARVCTSRPREPQEIKAAAAERSAGRRRLARSAPATGYRSPAEEGVSLFAGTTLLPVLKTGSEEPAAGFVRYGQRRRHRRGCCSDACNI
jgi:hypothetical protein